MSQHQKGALYHQYDWNFHNMIGYMLRLDGSVKDDNGKSKMVAFYSRSLMKVGHESYLQGCVWNCTQCENCQRIGYLAGTLDVM